jgi:hypothetical protein
MQGGLSSGSYVAGLTAGACNYSPVERPLRCNRKTNCSQLQEVLLQSLSVSFVFLLVVQRFDRFLYISVGDVTIKAQQIEACPTHLHAVMCSIGGCPPLMHIIVRIARMQ